MDFATPPLGETVGTLTDKQLEILDLLAEGLTGKEIAARLRISNSGATQRIETVRRKFGGLTKNELARTWRGYRDSLPLSCNDEPCKKLTGQKNHLPESGEERQEACRNQSASELEFADPYIFDASAPWSPKKDVSLVPEVLNGDDAVPARWVFVVGVAIGIAVLLLVLLAVSTAIGQLV